MLGMVDIHALPATTYDYNAGPIEEVPPTFVVCFSMTAFLEGAISKYLVRPTKLLMSL